MVHQDQSKFDNIEDNLTKAKDYVEKTIKNLV